MNGQLFLVTGGTGFLGMHLLAELAARGCRARLFCRKAPLQPPPGAEVALGTLTDVDALVEAARGCSGIFHLAGEVLHTRDAQAGRSMWATNVEGTEAVLRAAGTARLRVVYASTSGVVGCSTTADRVDTAVTRHPRASSPS